MTTIHRSGARVDLTSAEFFYLKIDFITKFDTKGGKSMSGKTTGFLRFLQRLDLIKVW